MEMDQGIREALQMIRGGKKSSTEGFLLLEMIIDEYIYHPRELPREEWAPPLREPPSQ